MFLTIFARLVRLDLLAMARMLQRAAYANTYLTMFALTVLPGIMRPSEKTQLELLTRQQLIALLVRLVNTMATGTPVKSAWHARAVHTALHQQLHVSPVLLEIMRPKKQTKIQL